MKPAETAQPKTEEKSPVGQQGELQTGGSGGGHTKDESQTPAALGRKIQTLAREKNVAMGKINAWGKEKWGAGWMSDANHLQTIIMNLNQGMSFE